MMHFFSILFTCQHHFSLLPVIFPLLFPLLILLLSSLCYLSTSTSPFSSPLVSFLASLATHLGILQTKTKRRKRCNMSEYGHVYSSISGSQGSGICKPIAMYRLRKMFRLTKFYQYSYRRDVKVVTDHKPLVTIRAKPLENAPNRLQHSDALEISRITIHTCERSCCRRCTK